jgi:hypothetical protein
MGTEASYPGPLYARLQESLYNWYGNVGGVIYVLAVVATILFTVAFIVLTLTALPAGTRSSREIGHHETPVRS